MKFVLARNQEGTEAGLLSVNDWNSDSVLRKDVDGIPLVLVTVFDVKSWRDARTFYDEWTNNGIPFAWIAKKK